jgi:hypothetical protein
VWRERGGGTVAILERKILRLVNGLVGRVMDKVHGDCLNRPAKPEERGMKKVERA